EPEILDGVPPDGMAVVAIPLGVVILDENAGTLNPVVVQVPSLRAARPGEVHLVEERRILVIAPLPLDDLLRCPRDVGEDQHAENLALSGSERVAGDALR